MELLLRARPLRRGRVHLLCSLLVGAMLVSSLPCDAARWIVNPRLGLGLTYSDNVNLDPSGQEESGLVGQVVPGVAIQGTGGRMRLNLDYELQHMLSSTSAVSNRTNQRAQGDISIELLKNRLFLEGDASRRQAFDAQDDRFSPDGIANSGFTSTTYSVGPRYNFRLGGYANWRGIMRYDKVDNGRGDISSTTGYRIDTTLSSGWRFTPLSWFATMNRRKLNNTDDPDTDFQNYRYGARYRLYRDYTLIADGGYFRNKQSGDNRNDNFRGNRILDSRDGSYFRVGLGWTPSSSTNVIGLVGKDSASLGATWSPFREWLLTGLVGENSGRMFWDGGVTWKPTTRTEAELGYRRSEFGLDTNSQWRARFLHRRDRWTLEASYNQSTGTPQILQLTRDFIRDPTTGAPTVGDNGGLQTNDSGTLNRIRGGLFVSKRYELRATRNSNKNTWDLRVFHEQRLGQDREDDTKTTGVRASWRWRITGPTSSEVSVNWQNNKFEDTGRDDDLWYAFWRLSHRTTRRVTTNLTLRHNERTSNDSDREYKENAIVLFMNIRFR